MDYGLVMLTAVSKVTDELTDDELVAIYMATTAGFDPTQVMGYGKAKSLFTEGNGTRMHQETRRALDQIVGERIK